MWIFVPSILQSIDARICVESTRSNLPVSELRRRRLLGNENKSFVENQATRSMKLKAFLASDNGQVYLCTLCKFDRIAIEMYRRIEQRTSNFRLKRRCCSDEFHRMTNTGIRFAVLYASGVHRWRKRGKEARRYLETKKRKRKPDMHGIKCFATEP